MRVVRLVAFNGLFETRTKLLDEKNQLLEQLEGQMRILGEKRLNLEQVIRERDNYVG